MKNKILRYVGLGGILLLLVGTFAMGSMNKKTANSNSVNNMASHYRKERQAGSLTEEELSKYRSKDIPEVCRLPDYDNNINKWKEHLSHHEETLYCLDYLNKE